MVSVLIAAVIPYSELMLIRSSQRQHHAKKNNFLIAPPSFENEIYKGRNLEKVHQFHRKKNENEISFPSRVFACGQKL